MKKFLIVLAVLLVILIAFGSYAVKTYNGLVNLQEEVNTAWSNVENQYQRRADLIPNLVNTVKGYANHEQSTLEAVVNARAKATQVTIDPTKMDAAALQEYQSAQSGLSQALGRLLFVSENYPDLKADKNFMALQTQLEGTENRISTERMRFNDAAKIYNTKIRRFPGSIIAGMTGFETKPYFEAEKGTEKAPEVNF